MIFSAEYTWHEKSFRKLHSIFVKAKKLSDITVSGSFNVNMSNEQTKTEAYAISGIYSDESVESISNGVEISCIGGNPALINTISGTSITFNAPSLPIECIALLFKYESAMKIISINLYKNQH